MQLASVAASVLAPAVSSVVGPLVQQLAGPLTNALGGAASEFGKVVGAFENTFLGPLLQLGQKLAPPVGQFSPLPLPFPKPPSANNPLQAFTGNSSSNFSPEDIAKIGGNIDALQNKAMETLQKPNASQQDIILAQNDLQKANLMFSTLSDILKQKTQQAQKAIDAGAQA